jgi:hypothetical protein
MRDRRRGFTSLSPDSSKSTLRGRQPILVPPPVHRMSANAVVRMQITSKSILLGKALPAATIFLAPDAGSADRLIDSSPAHNPSGRWARGAPMPYPDETFDGFLIIVDPTIIKRRNAVLLCSVKNPRTIIPTTIMTSVTTAEHPKPPLSRERSGM